MPYQTNKIKQMSKVKQMVFISVLVAQAMVLNYIERFIPLSFVIPVPGVKLGLANIITLTSIYILSFGQALSVVLLRTILTAVMFGSVSSFLYSISGGLLSFVVMFILVRFTKDKMSTMGISVVGAFFHNLGQLVLASLIIHNIGVMGYLPILMLAGIAAGIIVGMTVKLLMKYIIRMV